jgi:large repetitive protein
LGGCVETVNPVAVIQATPLRGYPPLDVSFDASASQGVNSGIASYRWDFGDGSVESTPIASHSFQEKGVHEVELVVTDADGRIGASMISIQVLNRVPHADFRITPFGAPRDYPVSFDASSSYDADGEIVAFRWDFGDGETAEGMHVEHVFPQQQTEYLVTLTVVDNDGALNHSARTVVVLGCDTCG